MPLTNTGSSRIRCSATSTTRHAPQPAVRCSAASTSRCGGRRRALEHVAARADATGSGAPPPPHPAARAAGRAGVPLQGPPPARGDGDESLRGSPPPAHVLRRRSRVWMGMSAVGPAAASACGRG
ncbi:hypothetical protein GQ55_7G079400 [Panicum hallii var. hallii]|uniref:Uncharacterized protein n=1 Tax=Panicum hallii var. hallii TaxID=1504633 RepID=A0A2T7CSW8_9POAL|nr:hypothetical protein GQ55_7G079400 [Panicum hallii var. hallii]